MKVLQREKRFPSATGSCDIRCRLWIPEEVRAAVQIVHGMAEHIDRYADFAMFLAENGVLVYGQDLAGHGKSVGQGGQLGYFCDENGWDALLKDMRTLFDSIKRENPAIPFILFGHSMGSFLARTYAGRDGADFDAYVFSGTAGKNPALGIAKWLARREIKKNGGREPSQTLHKLSFGAYNRAFSPARTGFEWLSRDEKQVDKYVADPLCGFAFTARGMRDLFDGLSEISSAAWAKNVPNKPILLLSGDCDPVGAKGKGVKQVHHLLKATGHDAEIKLYEGGRHEMLNELNRDEVYRDVLLFIEAVAAQGELK